MRENDKVLSRCVDHTRRDTIDDDMLSAKKHYDNLGIQTRRHANKVSSLPYIVS